MSTVNANVKTLVTPANVHGQLCDTLVIDTKNVTNDYQSNKTSAPVILTSAQFVNSAGVYTPPAPAPGQQPNQVGLVRRYAAVVSAFDAATISAAIFAAVASQTGYAYES